MAVLINGNTASAAELFASALRDYDKAKLIGTKSYGKGTMQTMMRLTDNSALSISTQMYNPPYSENYEGKGIVPDIELDLTEEQYSGFHLLTLDEDPQLQAAYGTLGFETEQQEEIPDKTEGIPETEVENEAEKEIQETQE
jgi:carboxyl-terminal processing protease